MRLLTSIGIIIGALCVSVLAPTSVGAHTPRFVSVEQHDATTVTDPEVSQAFYGELNDFPHLFEISSENEFDLFAEILSPDIEGAIQDFSGIVILRKRRGVDEVARFSGKEASWESFFEWAGGDSYLRGPSFEKRLPAGSYAVEVSTPINKGKYVIVIGKREEFDWMNYVGTLRDISRIKEFFGKSKVMIIQSPFVYVPLLLILSVGGAVYCHYRRRNT